MSLTDKSSHGSLASAVSELQAPNNVCNPSKFGTFDSTLGRFGEHHKSPSLAVSVLVVTIGSSIVGGCLSFVVGGVTSTRGFDAGNPIAEPFASGIAGAGTIVLTATFCQACQAKFSS